MLTSMLIDDAVHGGEARFVTVDRILTMLNAPVDPVEADQEQIERMESALEARFNVTPDDVPDGEFVLVEGIGPIVDPLLAAE